jgi:hypothetical protein
MRVLGVAGDGVGSVGDGGAAVCLAKRFVSRSKCFRGGRDPVIGSVLFDRNRSKPRPPTSIPRRDDRIAAKLCSEVKVI